MLNASDYAVLSLVYEYLQRTGRICVTYDGLLSYAMKYKRTPYKAETIQRCMRNLANHGFFRKEKGINRETNREIVLFYPTPKFYAFFNKNKSVRQ